MHQIIAGADGRLLVDLLLQSFQVVIIFFEDDVMNMAFSRGLTSFHVPTYFLPSAIAVL